MGKPAGVILTVLALLCFLVPQARAVTIVNKSSQAVAGSISFEGRATPIFQFYLQPKERVRWSKHFNGGTFVIKALPDRESSKSIPSPARIVVDDLNCYIEIQRTGRDVRLSVDE